MEKIIGTAEAWESGQLGRDEAHARKVSRDRSMMIDASLGLKSISIRLQEELIDDLKALAHNGGIGYQPLVRHILTVYVEAEKKKLALESRPPLRELIKAAKVENPECQYQPPRVKTA